MEWKKRMTKKYKGGGEGEEKEKGAEKAGDSSDPHRAAQRFPFMSSPLISRKSYRKDAYYIRRKEEVEEVEEVEKEKGEGGGYKEGAAESLVRRGGGGEGEEKEVEGLHRKGESDRRALN